MIELLLPLDFFQNNSSSLLLPFFPVLVIFCSSLSRVREESVERKRNATPRNGRNRFGDLQRQRKTNSSSIILQFFKWLGGRKKRSPKLTVHVKHGQRWKSTNSVWPSAYWGKITLEVISSITPISLQQIVHGIKWQQARGWANLGLIRNFWIVSYQFVRLTTPALPRIVVALFRQSTKAHIFHYSPSHAWFIPSFTLSANQVVSWTCPCCVACSDWMEMTITWLISRPVQSKAALAVRRPIDAIKRQRHLSEIISSISSSPKANINRYYMCDLKMACTLTSCEHCRLSV